MGSPETIPGLSHQVLVQIEILRNRIYHYPRRACETVVYKPRPRIPAPALPLEVRWVVTGLRGTQCVVIAPKNPRDHTFARGTSFQIGPDTNTVTSGRPSHGAGPTGCHLWRYDIVLLSGPRGKVLDRLDPGVIIKDYP